MIRLTTIALAVLTTWLASAPSGAQGPRFRSGIELVRVDVQVRASGRPVTGLTAADFGLKDSGVVQTIDAISLEQLPLSVILALDASISLQGQALEYLKDAARKATDALRADDECALLAFSQQIVLRAGWTANHDVLRAAIDKLRPVGLTSLYDATFAGIGLRERARGRTLLIAFTDGFDTSSWLDGPAVIQAARRSDIVVYAVSAGALSSAPLSRRGTATFGSERALRRAFEADPDLLRFAFLEELTTDTGGDLIRVGSTRDLGGVFARIIEEFKTRYVLTYSPARVPASGWHPIEVKLKGRSGEVRARRGYTR